MEFSGTALGIFTVIAKDSGNLLYSVDNTEYKEISTWDKWALSFDRPGELILENSLNPGKHTLKIKVSKNKEEKSEGNYIRIIAFMADKPE